MCHPSFLATPDVVTLDEDHMTTSGDQDHEAQSVALAATIDPGQVVSWELLRTQLPGIMLLGFLCRKGLVSFEGNRARQDTQLCQSI